MLRTISVSVAALIFSAIIAAGATFFVLHHTEFGRVAVGGASGMADPWKVFMNGYWILLAYVCVPTVTLVAIFVGVLAKRSPAMVALVAAIPISFLASGFDLKNAWVSIALLVVAVVVASCTHLLVWKRQSARQVG